MCGFTCCNSIRTPPPLILLTSTCTHTCSRAHRYTYTPIHTNTFTHTRTHAHTHRVCVSLPAPLSGMRATATTRRTTRAYVAMPRLLPLRILLAGIIGCQVGWVGCSFGPLLVLYTYLVILKSSSLLFLEMYTVGLRHCRYR